MKSNNLKRGEINENCGREICLKPQQKKLFALGMDQDSGTLILRPKAYKA